MCLNGTQQGPVQERGACLQGWVYGPADAPLCPNCANRTSCSDCKRNVNCMWCQKFGNCQNLQADDTNCIVQTAACTCDLHEHCGTCSADSNCWWCEERRRCFDLQTTQVTGCSFQPPKPVCPACDQLPDCQRCLQTTGCGFCGASCKAATQCPGGAGVADCDANCRLQLGCEQCIFSPGCSWCLDYGRCEGTDMIKLQPCQTFAVTCPRPSSFDTGSFFGGMALVVGLAAAGFGVYFIVRYYSRRSAYTTV